MTTRYPEKTGRRLLSRSTLAALLVAMLVLVLGACKPQQPVTPVEPPRKPETIGELADVGAKTFSDRCARCHGAQGQGIIGPALIGATANLTKFQTADGIYSYISLAMPMDAPGTLTTDEYTQVLGFLLVKNGLAPEEQSFNGDGLKGINLLP